MLSHNIPITWSTFFSSILSNWFLFHTYWEFECLSSHSCIRSLPSSLLPFLSGYSGSVWFRCMRPLRPPANMTSIPSPCVYSVSCKAEMRWVISCLLWKWCQYFRLVTTLHKLLVIRTKQKSDLQLHYMRKYRELKGWKWAAFPCLLFKRYQFVRLVMLK